MSENSYAEAARAKKILAMVQFFDRRFIAVGRCPYREASDLADMLRGCSEDQWKHHAVQAGQNKPSSTTVALIIKVYEDRAAERATINNVTSIRRYGGVN